LCKTSNPGSNDLLALKLSSNETVFERIGRLVGNEWAQKCNGALGLVVGATDPEALQRARKAAGSDVWILAPGVGAQGGDLLAAAKAGLNANGTGMLIPVSRGISRANDPGQAAKELQEKIQSVREQVIQQTSLADTSIQAYQR